MKRHDLQQILDATLHCCVIKHDEWERLRHGREGRIVRARQLLSLIASNEGYSASEIAEFLHHHRTTVIYNIKVLKEQIAIYPGIQDLVDMIVKKIGPPPMECQKDMVTYGWLARSSTGLLTISPSCPEKMGGYWMAEGSKPFPRKHFPWITYDKGPVKVKVIVTIEEDGKM